MDKIYFKASINNTFIYVETLADLMPKLYDHFTDGGYKIEKVEVEVIEEAVRGGEIAYYATDPEVVEAFIQTQQKVKHIRNNE